MAQIAEISVQAAELYLLRFCVSLSRQNVPIAAKRFCPLLEFAQIEWSVRSPGIVYVAIDRRPIDVLTGEHFNMIQLNALGFGQLFVFFPPRTQPSGDEGRLLLRAGVPIKFAPHKIGVYI